MVFIEIQNSNFPDKQHLELYKNSQSLTGLAAMLINAICCTYDSLILALQELANATDYSGWATVWFS